MGCISGLGQCILVLLNVIFVLVSLIFIIVGIILRFFPGVIFKFLVDGVKGVTDAFKIPDGSGDLDTVPLVDQLGLALLGFGFVLFFISFLACCGACCQLRPLLGLFIVLAGIMALSIAAVGGVFMSPNSSLHTKIKDEMAKEVTVDYMGPQNSDVFSLLVNIMSYSLECCGMKGPDDFNHTASWTAYKREKTSPIIHIDVTPACCNHTALKANNLLCAMMSSPGKFDPKLTNVKGCYDQILDKIDENKKWAIIVIVVLMSLLILEMVFAIAMIRTINNTVNPV